MCALGLCNIRGLRASSLQLADSANAIALRAVVAVSIIAPVLPLLLKGTEMPLVIADSSLYQGRPQIDTVSILIFMSAAFFSLDPPVDLVAGNIVAVSISDFMRVSIRNQQDCL